MTRTMIATVLALALGVATAAAQTPARAAAPKPTVDADSPINLNTATPAQLETLPGIGPATAQRILEYRQKNGGFKKIEELMNVRGIGERNFLKLKALITLPPPRTDRAAAQAP